MKEYKIFRERRLYRVLQDMKSRCYNPKNNHYHNYSEEVFLTKAEAEAKLKELKGEV